MRTRIALTGCIREDKAIKQKKPERAGWYTGGVSTLRNHLAVAHYEIYSQRCAAAGIKENYRCI